MIVNSYPPKVHTAFNPAVLNVSPGVETKAKIIVAVQGNTFIGYFTIEKDFFDNVAKFDLSKVLRKHFTDDVNERPAAGGILPLFIDYNLFISYWVRDIDNNPLMDAGDNVVLNNEEPTQRALNAVVQIGHPADKTGKYFKFLTKYESLKLYRGYSPALSFLSGLGEGKLLFVNKNRNLIHNSWLNFETSAYLLFLADLTEDFIAGKQYTLSVKSFFDVVQIWVDGGNVLIGNTTYKGGGISEITFTAPAITTPAEKRRLYIYKTAPSAVVGGMFWVKLETGNISTDWTPAPEDIASTPDVELAAFTVNVSQNTFDDEYGVNNYDLDHIDILDSDGYVSDIKPVELLCDPENPFFVKWINQSGGWDNWMFERRQIFKKNIANQESYSPVIDDILLARTTQKVISMSGVEKVTVGTEGLTINDYKELSKIIYSPAIKWYNEEIGQWVQIHIDPNELAFDTKEVKAEIELTFILPEPQLQF